MKKIFIITVIFLISSNFALSNVKEIEKMFKKGAKYNLGINQTDTTIQGLKLKPHTKIRAFKYSKKKGYGWTNYGIKVVKKSDNNPIRYGDTAIRFELRHEDCGFLYKNRKERDCERSTPHHRVEVSIDEKSAFKHKQEFWYTFSYYVPKNFKFYRKQSVFQFHSTEGPYSPPFQLEVVPKWGLTAKISPSQDVYPETEGDCGGSIKEKVNYCENILLEYIVIPSSELNALTGTWIDFVIHSVWDKSSSDDKNNNGLHELFINGEKKLHYEGQNMWRKGGSLLEFGIYGSKNVKRYMGLLPNEEDVINVPRIAFYDEIWVKKSCEDLDLERLGYSCQNLFNQDDNVTKPDQADRPD